MWDKLTGESEGGSAYGRGPGPRRTADDQRVCPDRGAAGRKGGEPSVGHANRNRPVVFKPTTGCQSFQMLSQLGAGQGPASFCLGRAPYRRNGGSCFLRDSLTGRTGSGFQPAMVRAHCRAWPMLVTPWEQPAQFDRGGQLALLLEHGTDRCGLDLGDEPNVAAAWRRWPWPSKRLDWTRPTRPG